MHWNCWWAGRKHVPLKVFFLLNGAWRPLQWPCDIIPEHILWLSLWQNSHLPSHPAFILFYWIDLMPYLLFYHICWLFEERIVIWKLYVYLTFSFFFQDVRAQLCPPSGEGPAGDAVWPRHADQRRKDWRDGDWPGESLPIQIWSHVRPAAVLLRVSWDILRFLPFIFVIIFQMQSSSLSPCQHSFLSSLTHQFGSEPVAGSADTQAAAVQSVWAMEPANARLPGRHGPL